MKTTIRILMAAVAIAGLSIATIGAQMAQPKNLHLSKGSKLWIDGTSTVKSFSCAATKVDVSASSKPGSAPNDLVASASIVVPVASLDCKNATMNEHMRKALKGKANPAISWRMTSYRVEGTSVVMIGRLMIAGRENAIELRATGNADNDGTIRMKGSTKFNMSEYGVKPPSLMLGTMKVRDPITVSFDLMLSPS